ncbi:MAG: Transcriptional regulator containing domain, AraC family [Verrucomicrobiota bacterium]|jgi:AraC-like DNA-binding protein
MPRNAKTPPPRFEGEVAAWAAVGAGWRQLFGSFGDLGFSLEWHDFHSAGPIDWARSFHPGSVELCLNLIGEGSVQGGSRTARFGSQTAGFYRQGRTPLSAARSADQTHRFITVEFRPDFLARELGDSRECLHPLIRDSLQDAPAVSGVSEPGPLTARQRDLVMALRQPPVLAGAQKLWYGAKVRELMSEFFFVPPADAELFCHRQQRVARDRVDTVVESLKKDLANPPSLEAIAREAACSPFYLSRTFSKEMGQTIPQYLRQLRMEKAASLLRSGSFNVTEAALEVGYSSLSHFSAAFHQTFGCCPGLYPMATPTQKAATVKS